MGDALQQAFWDHTWAILIIMAIGVLIGILWGWIIWGRYKKLVESAREEANEWHAKYTDLEKEHAGLRYEKDELDKQLAASKTSLRRCEADKAILDGKLTRLREQMGEQSGAETAPLGFVPSGNAGLSYATIFKSDDLKIVEGIGPKIEALLKDNGINTWGDLANTSTDHLQEILNAAGNSFQMQKPDTWPHQAKLAHEGKWEELIHYQKTADATTVDGDGNLVETPSKVEKLAMGILGFSNNPEDLKVIEGIGPKIEQLLKADGINDWSALAAAKLERLKRILNDAGDNFRLAKPDTWPKQAELAAARKWGELKEYQDYLQGGKDHA